MNFVTIRCAPCSELLLAYTQIHAPNLVKLFHARSTGLWYPGECVKWQRLHESQAVLLGVGVSGNGFHARRLNHPPCLMNHRFGHQINQDALHPSLVACCHTCNLEWVEMGSKEWTCAKEAHTQAPCVLPKSNWHLGEPTPAVRLRF